MHFLETNQQKTAHFPSSRASGFLRGSLNSISLNSLASALAGVRMISVVPSAPILVSTSFFWSLGSQLFSEIKVVFDFVTLALSTVPDLSIKIVNNWAIAA